MPKYLPEIQINGRCGGVEIQTPMLYHLPQVSLPLVLGVPLSLGRLPASHLEGQKACSLVVKSADFGVREIWVHHYYIVGGPLRVVVRIKYVYISEWLGHST